ncbi:cellulose biosynthesis protein BcsP [Undibacterium sp. Ji49W]|uniref:cellulose biosynthesis protein BcsP n=1 Tax=Undibacterium sp. Ji49W TaxID=3413040 RepID=UPI003BEFB972
MDDDVKNLFQKFGQTTEAYREINRDADSEQARQRWPLLRDVHVNGAPAPKRAHAQEHVAATPAEAGQNTGMFNPAGNKAIAKPASPKASNTPAPATSLLAAAAAPVAVKTPPLKQILSRQEIDSDVKEELAPAIAPAPAFMTKNRATAPREVLHAAARVEVPAASLFAQRQPVDKEPPKANAPAPLLAPAPKPSFFSAPAAATVPTAPAATPATASVLQSIGGRRTATQAPAQINAQPAGEVPLSAVFGRLAAKPEAEKPVETGVNSFFKKIFKP